MTWAHSADEEQLQAVPPRYTKHNLSDLDEAFAMGRGLQRPAEEGHPAVDVPALVSADD